MLQLRLLGTLELIDDGGHECSEVLAQPKRFALLAYLAAATPRGSHRRDTLLPLLWPESDQAHARLALRQALHALRDALGERVILGRGDEIGLDAQSIACDVAAFDAAAAAGRLEEAIELYRGDLLPGFFVANAPEFERWLERERTRLREAAVASARTLVERAEANGDVATAIARARRAVRLAPLDEALVRRLIALRDRSGDRAGAVEAYDSFASHLAQELEVEPAPETRALVERVRARVEPGFVEPSPPAWIRTAQALAAISAPGRNRVRLLGALVAATLVGLTSLALVLGRSPHATTSLDPNRVAVSTFVNRTDDSSLNSVAELAAAWISDRLVRSGLVQVADPGSDPGGPGARRRTEGGTDARRLALATGSGITVSGAVYRHGDSIEFQTRISDEVHQTLLRGVSPVLGAARDPRAAIGTLTQRVTAALATVINPKLSEFANLVSQPPTYEAYRAFAAGADAWYDADDPALALSYFYRAARLDSSYSLPLVWAAWVHRMRGECAQTDSLGRALAARADQLAPVDGLYLQRELAFCRGDLVAGYRLSRELVVALPASEAAACELARDALAIGRPREALAILTRLHPDRGALRGHRPYYLFLTTAYHLLGEHTEELAAARRAERQFPNVLGPRREELVALAALGREADVLTNLDDISRITGRRSPGDVMRETALELRAHGHPEAGREVLRRALALVDSRSAAERGAERSLEERLRLMYAAERWSEARSLADRLVAGHPDNPRYLGVQGVLDARRGARDEALRVDQLLAARWTRIPQRGEAALWRACIAARLGDPTHAAELLQGAADLQWGAYYNTNLWLLALHTDPCFDSLHGMPTFDALLNPKG